PFYVATSGESHPERGDAMSSSVMRVGMLPQRAWKTASGLEVDVSAMSGIDAESFGDSVVDGFREAARLIAGRKQDWTKPGGVIDRLRGIQTRLIVRPTRAYGMLLRESTHPDVMRDENGRRELMKVLSPTKGSNSTSQKFVESETAAMYREDIPVFGIDVESGWVHSCSDSRIVQLQPSPLVQLRERLDAWSDETIDRECQTIRMALNANDCEPEKANRQSHHRSHVVTTDPIDFLVTTSVEIADRLYTRCYGDDWLDLTLTDDQSRWCVSRVDNDLYSGRSGIALALATIARQTGIKRFEERAVATLMPMCQPNQIESENRVGAFSGIAGKVYSLVHLADLLHDPHWLDVANRELEGLVEKILADEHVDLIGGAAGCLATLDAIGGVLRSDHVEPCKAACVRRLCESAVLGHDGACWPLDCFQGRGMTGMAHGNAGIAMALSCPCDNLQTMAQRRGISEQAVRFEQAHFDHERGVWKDLRHDSGDHMTAWCHGAPGIGIGRLRMIGNGNSTELEQQLEVAVSATLQDGFGSSHCLCHGDLGNLDFLTMVSLRFPAIISADHVLELGCQVAQSIRQVGPRCGTPRNIETPGLMTGLAGLAWGLIRASAPGDVPSVLALQPPNTAAAAQESSEFESHHQGA
ncbi:MAG: type 2 lanthipeptide synthetase LanM family protein, partial [Planctomycetota bacterium]